MKKLLIIAVLALLLTALVGTAAIGSGGANSAGAADAKVVYQYQMTPGTSKIDQYSVLYDALSARAFDVLVIMNTGTSSGSLKVEIEDCCVMGDTMAGILIRPGASPVVKYATSPAVVTLGPVSMSAGSWALVIQGYLQCPGGFPAGYYYSIWL